MIIETGRLMSKTVITKLLKAVPNCYLKKVKEVIVTPNPDKEFKKENPRWGGVWGTCNKRKGIIFIYVLSITRHISNELYRGRNSNWYHSAIEKIARTIYYEIGALNFRARAKSRLDFEEKMIKKAHKKNLLGVPNLKKIRFLKMRRDICINSCMELLREEREFNRVLLPAVEHLRKVKLGLNYKYSISELYDARFSGIQGKFGEKTTEQLKGVHLPDYTKRILWDKESHRLFYNSTACFKRRVLKIVKGGYYISKTGRKYAYFTDKDLGRLRKKMKWYPLRKKLKFRDDILIMNSATQLFGFNKQVGE